MNSPLRSDEEFVICALANHFNGTWRPGENPPDVYLLVGTEDTAVEISTLTQQVRDEHGRLKPRLSEDTTAIRLANALNEELQSQVPIGWMVILTLTSPVLHARMVYNQLKERISNLISNKRNCKSEEIILGNKIDIQVVAESRQSGKKVVGIIQNANSSPDIFKNAWEILEDRIVVKANICRSLSFFGPKWLALLNDYGLADNEIYEQAFNSFSVDHPFEKIMLVSPDGSVAVLGEKV